jgi:hypothetical protein
MTSIAKLEVLGACWVIVPRNDELKGNLTTKSILIVQSIHIVAGEVCIGEVVWVIKISCDEDTMKKDTISQWHEEGSARYISNICGDSKPSIQWIKGKNGFVSNSVVTEKSIYHHSNFNVSLFSMMIKHRGKGHCGDEIMRWLHWVANFTLGELKLW